MTNIYKMSLKTILCILLGSFLSTSTYAQTLHAIVFSATEDETIGVANETSYQLLRDEIEKIGYNTGMDVQLYPYIDENFTKANVAQVLFDLDKIDLSNDVVLFYFLGHGFSSEETKWPNLLFMNTAEGKPLGQSDVKAASLNLEAIEQSLSQKNARLTIVMAEASNDELGKINAVAPEEGVDFDLFKTDEGSLSDEERYKDLFLFSRGSIVASSSKPEYLSYYNEKQGGLFTRGFLGALKVQVAKDYQADWGSFLLDVQRRTKSLAKSNNLSQSAQYLQNVKYERPGPDIKGGKKPRVGFISKLIGIGFPTKIERAFKKALKKGDLLSLEAILAGQGEKGDKLKNKMKRKNPVTFFMTQAIVYEGKSDSAKAFLNYSIAYHLGKENRTKLDQRLIDKIQRLDKNYNELALGKSKNYQTWLKNKYEIYLDSYETDIFAIDKQIAAIEGEIEQIEDEIHLMEKTIVKNEDDIKSMTKTIDLIDVKRNQVIDVTLDINENSESVISEIDSVLQQIEAGKIVDNQDKRLIGDTKVEFKFAKRNTASGIDIAPEGYPIAQYCTDDIKDVTYGIMKVLLKQIKDVPFQQRSEIKVKLAFTGNADWRGAGKLLNVEYTSPSKIFQEYENKDGEVKTFQLEAGETRFVTNEELAFLRAHCAYEIIVGLLLNAGVRDYEASFKAIEHADPSKPDPSTLEGAEAAFEEVTSDTPQYYTGFESEIDSSKGKEFRGVDIDMVIENLFKHYVDKLKRLEEDIEKKGKDIEKIKKDIKKKEKDIEVQEELIAKEEEKKEALEQIIANVQVKKGYKSRANREVERVRRIQGKKR